MNPTIVICTVNSPTVSVLLESISAYAPEYKVVRRKEPPSTFGEAFNKAISEVFEDADEIIMSNDDVVLLPTSISALMEDVRYLQGKHGDKLGLVATYSDNVRGVQNVRYANETELKEVRVLSPLLAWISKTAFQSAQFPPINWYSDDVICEDLNELGFKNFISRSYVHHVGSQTVGTNYAQLNAAAMSWLEENRPHYIKKWFHRIK